MAEEDRDVVILREEGMPQVDIPLVENQNKDQNKQHNELIFSRATRRYLRIRQSGDGINKKVATGNMVIGLFEEEMKDDVFFAFYTNELILASPDLLKNFFHYAHMQAPCPGHKTELWQV